MEKSIPKTVSIKSEYVTSLLKSAQELFEAIKKETNKLLAVPTFFGGNGNFVELMKLQNGLQLKLHYTKKLKKMHEEYPADQAITMEYETQIEELVKLFKSTSEKFETLRK